MSNRYPKIDGSVVSTLTEVKRAVSAHSPQRPLDYVVVNKQRSEFLRLFNVYCFYGEVNLTPYLLHIMNVMSSPDCVDSFKLSAWKNDIFTQEVFDKIGVKLSGQCFTDLSRIKGCINNAEQGDISPDADDIRLFLDNAAAVFEQLSSQEGLLSHKKWIYYSVTAFYCLAGVSFREHPAETEAFNNDADPMKYTREKLLLTDRDILFKKSYQTYILPTEEWQEGEEVTLKRLRNCLDNGFRLSFEFVNAEDGSLRSKIYFYPDEYFYVYVNERGAIVHIPSPISVKNNMAALRDGLSAHIEIVSKDGALPVFSLNKKDAEEIASFVSDGEGGLAFISGGRICCDYMRSNRLAEIIEEEITADPRFESSLADLTIDEDGYIYCINTRGEVKTTNPEISHREARAKIINRDLILEIPHSNICIRQKNSQRDIAFDD